MYPFGIWMLGSFIPSITSIRPIISKNDRASILMDGYLFTKPEILLANNIMIIIEIITAMIITVITSVTPTAVRTESKEKTISIRTICRTMAEKVPFFFLTAFSSSLIPVIFLWISVVLLYIRNSP